MVIRMTGNLNYNEVNQFMKDFKIDVLNRFDELIIDVHTNTYTYIGDCKNIDEVKTRVVYSLCRPIGKVLKIPDAMRLLENFNSYFKLELTREDMRLMYQKLCYMSKLEMFNDFIKRGFPMQELENIE